MQMNAVALSKWTNKNGFLWNIPENNVDLERKRIYKTTNRTLNVQLLISSLIGFYAPDEIIRIEINIKIESSG